MLLVGVEGIEPVLHFIISEAASTRSAHTQGGWWDEGIEPPQRDYTQCRSVSNPLHISLPHPILTNSTELPCLSLIAPVGH